VSAAPRGRLHRRAFLAGAARVAGASVSWPLASRAFAMGRTPLGGRIGFHVPWSTTSIDPHDLRDPMAALFGAAIADPLYALDASGQPYPALAAGMPSREAGETVVHLREGLRTARLAGLDARDVIVSVERASARGAAGLLADLPKPLLRKGEHLGVVFGDADPIRVARALASPLCALLPRKFDPARPDGTGAFRAEVSAASLVLTRNPNAARGASFLEAIDVAPAADLTTSLRAFEAEQDDLGWLGMGLHDGRRGAVRFDLGYVAWVVLSVGPDAGPAATPGFAQRLADAIPAVRIAHLGLGPLPPAPASGADPAWPGPPADLLVDDASPHLLEVARAIAPVLSNPGHEVTMKPTPRAEIARRRARGAATLAVEIVRPLGPTAHLAQLALATAEDPQRGRDVAKAPSHAHAVTTFNARSLTSLLRSGVLGELRVQGGVAADVVLAKPLSGEGWDLGASHRKLARRTP
jgi:peptide/nickel transport system substrate-binding protein